MIICPKCGSKSSEKEFIGPFCIDCHKFRFKTPKAVVIKHCKKCGRVWIGNGWVPHNKKKIEEMIASRFKGDFERIDYYLESSVAVMYFREDNKIYMIDKKFEPVLEFMHCPDCSRRSGGYYEAIIQLRGDRKKIEKWASKLIYDLNKKTFVTKVEERREGTDLFVGQSKAVFELLRELGLRTKISRKLYTQRKGKRLYRTTFAVRF